MADMVDPIREALATDRKIDIITTGRKSGELRRTEIWFRHAGGRIFITGLPGTRSWLADLPAKARIIIEEDERRQVLSLLLEDRSGTDFERWVAGSPRVEVEFL